MCAVVPWSPAPALVSSIPEADVLKLGTLLQSRLKETRPSGGSPDRCLEIPVQPLFSWRGEWISKPLLNHKAFTLFLKSSHPASLGHSGVPRCGPYFSNQDSPVESGKSGHPAVGRHRKTYESQNEDPLLHFA